MAATTKDAPKSYATERDPLSDFAARDVEFDGKRKKVFVAGDGPAVIVMAEMPGISPEVARFARWVRDAGFTVYMPVLFGDPGRPANNLFHGIGVMIRGCISREFHAFRSNSSGPIAQWLRALARLALEESGGKGVGAIGMCFTGNFALSMMLEPAMLAPVLSQPSLPLNDPAGTGITPAELTAVKERLDRDDLTVLAYRFKGDRFCQAQRFAAFSEALGDRFKPRVLEDSAANTDLSPFFAKHVTTPHSVVTAHLIDQAGQPTVVARDEILAFFASRLLS